VPGLLTLVPVYWFLGAMFAAIDLSTVGFAAEHGHTALAGLVLGTYALGSAIGGLWYGSRHWQAPLERRFAITLSLTVAGVATFWLQPGLVSLFAVIIVAGMSISPTLIAGYALIERQAPPERRTEGMTWLSSAIAVGVATGSPLAGHLIDAYGARWGYLLAAVCGCGAVLTSLAGLGRLRHPGGEAGQDSGPRAGGLRSPQADAEIRSRHARFRPGTRLRRAGRQSTARTGSRSLEEGVTHAAGTDSQAGHGQPCAASGGREPPGPQER
jgi:MFS family permease